MFYFPWSIGEHIRKNERERGVSHIKQSLLVYSPYAQRDCRGQRKRKMKRSKREKNPRTPLSRAFFLEPYKQLQNRSLNWGFPMNTYIWQAIIFCGPSFPTCPQSGFSTNNETLQFKSTKEHSESVHMLQDFGAFQSNSLWILLDKVCPLHFNHWLLILSVSVLKNTRNVI